MADGKFGFLDLRVPFLPIFSVQLFLGKVKGSETFVGVPGDNSVGFNESLRLQRLLGESVGDHRIGSLAHKNDLFVFVLNNYGHSLSSGREFTNIESFEFLLSPRCLHGHIVVTVHSSVLVSKLFRSVHKGKLIGRGSVIHTLLLIDDDVVTDSEVNYCTNKVKIIVFQILKHFRIVEVNIWQLPC